MWTVIIALLTKAYTKKYIKFKSLCQMIFSCGFFFLSPLAVSFPNAPAVAIVSDTLATSLDDFQKQIHRKEEPTITSCSF